ncbi:Nitroreductase-like protein [Ilyonectria robusta]|uniref:Nitroreductase-like protein n=1 Tax=Ilyonectria robusta TaxID=1079257 RepID=UPI001E8D860F|nr:Nitroreductase-like protein [Ilyonectria robusta]KAH8736586.1 Nitroreductase-like protein [Ilyonectria robusta]
MADKYLADIQSRRTCYSLEAKSPVSDARIVEIAREVIKHTPSSFNCQSTRLVVLLQDEHVKFWEIAKQCFKATLPKETYLDYEKKLCQRQGGYGTILLFEDLDVIRRYQAQFPRFMWHLPQFSEHNNAMQAFNLWTALALEGFGCNLQHVNPVVDQRIVGQWNISPQWSLKAQLVFGTPTGAPASEKSFAPTEDRLFIHGMSS